MKPPWLKALESALGAEKVAVDPANRLLYSRDMMSGGLLEEKAGREPRLPQAVCWPESLGEIQKVLKVARRYRIPVIPFGAGSGVSGGTTPVKGGIMLDLKRFTKMGAIEERRGQFFVTAESGILGQHLERDLNALGFTLGHFPSSMLCATVGGYLACRSAGQLSSKYGKIEDMIDAIEVILASGEVVPFGARAKKFPDLRSEDLFVGSEGCLGVLTKARFKVLPLPPMTLYRGLSFPRVEEALAAVRQILQSGLRPAVVRLYDPLDTILLKHGYKKKGRKKSGSDWYYPLVLRRPAFIQKLAERASSEVLLILAFEGEAELAREMERQALKFAAAFGAKDLGPEPGLHWRDHRYSVSFKMPKLFSEDCFVDTIEVATTWENLQALYDGMRKARMKRTQILVLAHFSHAYPEGCSIYFTVVGKCRAPEEDVRTYAEIWDDAMETCLKLGATISHHHGIGLLKAKYLPRELGGAMPFFQEIKKRIDPQGLLNPGKMGLHA